MLPLWPMQRFGWAGSVGVWLIAFIGLRVVSRTDPSLAAVLGIALLVYVILQLDLAATTEAPDALNDAVTTRTELEQSTAAQSIRCPPAIAIRRALARRR